MTKIKLCGLTRPEEIQVANALRPDYIGFVFAPKSRRYLPPQQAAALRALLRPEIQAVGVFVGEDPRVVARLLEAGIIDLAQLHGGEDAAYIQRLRGMTPKPLFQAFLIRTGGDIQAANHSPADGVLVDAGLGEGQAFDWKLLEGMERPYFLAGGLDPGNVARAVRQLHPYGVDVSSGIETAGRKDQKKMAAFVAAVRKEDGR